MFHDRLAEQYLKMTADARKRGDSGEASILYVILVYDLLSD